MSTKDPNTQGYEMTPLNNTGNNAAKPMHIPTHDDGSDGPVHTRKCTDIVCCILFVMSFCAFIGIAAYGYAKGKPYDLLGIYNDQGLMCSQSTSNPLAYMPSIDSANFTAVCVSSCPADANQTVQCLGSTCPLSTSYKSLSLGDVVCIPDPASSTVAQAMNFNVLTQVFADIKICYWIFVGALAGAFVVGFLYFWMMRWCAGVLVWLSLAVFTLGTVAVGVYMYLYTKGIKLIDTPFTLSQYSTESLQYTSYALWGIAGLTLILIICLYSRIRLAIAVVKSTSMYLAETCHIVFFPPCMAIVMVGVLTLIIAGFFFIYSVGDIVVSSPFASVTRTDTTEYLMYYQVFAGFWVVFFVSGFTTFVLCSSACIWYYSNSSVGEKPHRPILTSIARAFRYHLGSIAFGSLILALLALVRLLIAMLEHKPAANPNKCTQFVFKCAACCLRCLNCFMKYLTKAAYVQIAIKGVSYCEGAMAAFKLTLENPLRIAINTGLSSIIMFIGKATITTAITVSAYYSLMKIEYFSLRITSPLAPTIISGVIAFAVASIYMSVYGVSCNAIIQCFITDECEAQKQGRSAKYCPQPLREILEQQKSQDAKESGEKRA